MGLLTCTNVLALMRTPDAEKTLVTCHRVLAVSHGDPGGWGARAHDVTLTPTFRNTMRCTAPSTPVVSFLGRGEQGHVGSGGAKIL
jgi:hypothetical protein